MAQFFQLRPEVAGFQGEGTVVANMPQLQSGIDFIPEIAHLDYEFDGWLGETLSRGRPVILFQMFWLRQWNKIICQDTDWNPLQFRRQRYSTGGSPKWWSVHFRPL